MTKLADMDDNQFMNYVALSGDTMDINDFNVGDRVITRVLVGRFFKRESNGESMYVNSEMQDSSKKGEVLTVRKVRRHRNGYMVLSNGYAYYPEMIKEIL